ncbi:hypothetical protein Salat_2967000 [Sesamum alatum]|uniref:Uncharacterized protein n=1 Tax=Sesamum alatum TaxID=300844 RepID=A0AAE1XI01_9LAMI|nr:hypothetical protein Salat_2967000 [Sesamum alatum]
MKVGSSSSIQASRPLNLLNWAASSPSAGRLPSFPCLAGYLKPAFEPTKPSRTAIVLLALRLESLSYRLNLPIGGACLYSLGVPKGMAGRIEGIRTRCPRSGVGGGDIIHLIAWEKALRSFDLEAWAGALASWTRS